VKFGVKVDHSKSQLTNDKLSLKGTWSRHVTHFKLLVPQNISGMTLARDFKFYAPVGHVKY